MRRLIPSGALWALFVVVLAGICASAFAYFTANGLGSASAAVSKLTTPTIATATPAAGGTVALTWSAATAPDAEAVKYYVTRDGEDPGGTCAAPAVPAAATSCTDSGVAIGLHVYTVTAVWRSWSATSATKSATVTIGAATHYIVTASTQTPAVSAAANLTITAKDVNEATVTTYTGAKSLIFSGAESSPGGTAPTVVNSAGTAIAFGKATAINFSSGVATVSSSKNGLMKIYKSGPAEIVAGDGTIDNAAKPLSVNATPGTASKYTLAAATTTPAAGAADGLTITAADAYGNIASAYTGNHNLIFTNANGTTSPAGNIATASDVSGADIPFGTATEIEFDDGVAQAIGDANGEMKLYKSGTASVKATEGSLTNSTALALTVAPGTASKLVLTAATLTPVAAATDNLTTTAQDVYGNTATAYAGSKNLTFSGAEPGPGGTAPTVVNSAGTQISFGATTALTFTNGVAAVASSKNGMMRLYKAGATSVSVSDGSIATAAPVVFTVAVGTAARWALTELKASAGTITQPCLFTCPVTGLGNGGTISAKIAVTDSAGNTVSNVGSGHTAKVATSGGTVSGGTSLVVPTTGLAVSSTAFTYTAPASGAFTNTLTVSAALGTAYTTATATASK